MSILGEVRVSHLKCVQRFTQDMGATDVIDVKCRIAGSAGGKATIRASLHIRTVTFDDEEWKIITLMCSYMAGYETLFAPSCGSVGDFTDIQQDAEGNLAITSEMQCYNFSVRRLNGDWYAHVYPFDTKYFRKVHPAGALLFSGVHSHLMLLQYILINLPSAKTPFGLFPKSPSTGWNMMAPCAWMMRIDGSQLQQLSICARMAYTLSLTRSRRSLVTLFTTERVAELPMIHRQGFNI